MSDAFITRRGGGGGLSTLGAVLHVNAPVGSTITLAKGGVTVKVLDANKGHTSAEDDSLADWYYSVSPSNYGSWTVTATKDAESVSESITVDSNKQYDVELTYNQYLLKDGVFVYQIGGNDYTTTSGDGWIAINSVATWARVWIKLTQEMIDKPYTSLVVKALACNYSTGVNIGITNYNTADAAWLAYGTIKSTDTFPKTLTVDLSSISNNLVGNWFKLVIQSYPYTIQLSDVYLAR